MDRQKKREKERESVTDGQMKAIKERDRQTDRRRGRE